MFYFIYIIYIYIMLETCTTSDQRLGGIEPSKMHSLVRAAGIRLKGGMRSRPPITQGHAARAFPKVPPSLPKCIH